MNASEYQGANHSSRKAKIAAKTRRYFLVISIFLSILLTCVFLWGLYRILHVSVMPSVHKLTEMPKNPDETILCVGDGQTSGLGAPKGTDYPTQLTAILNASRTGRTWAAINRGSSGLNSSEAADAAIKFLTLAEKKPHLVIYNSGKTNLHNLTTARIFPEKFRTKDPIDWIEHLSSKSEEYGFDSVTTSRLDSLKKHPPAYEDLQYDTVLDVKGRGEQEFVERWIIADVETLLAEAGKTRTRVCLLNYWDTSTPWVDRAFQKVAQAHPDVIFIDVRLFGKGKTKPYSYESLVQKSWNPNEYGFALIAEAIYKELVQNSALRATREIKR